MRLKIRQLKANPACNQTGFGLLEALVSLVLFAGVGVVIIAWLQQSLSTATRLEASLSESAIRLVVLDHIKAINLIERPSGSQSLGRYIFQWRSESVVPEEPQIGYPLGLGNHGVSLLKVKLTAIDSGSQQMVVNEEIVLTAYRPLISNTAELIAR